jgi:uncharacterized membrane protein
MLITTISNVVILSSIVVVLGLGGYLAEWDTTGFLWFAGSGLLTSFMGRNMLFTSIGLVGSSRAAAVKNIAPVFTVSAAVLFLAEHLSVMAAVGIGLACLGLSVLVYEAFCGASANLELLNESEEPAKVALEPEVPVADDEVASNPSRSPGTSTLVIGTLIALLAAISFGLGQAIRKVGLEYMPDVFLGATIASWTALISYVGISALQGRTGSIFRTSFNNFRIHFWLAGLATTIGQLSFFAAITFAPVAHVSVIAASETLLTIFLAAIFIRRTENISRQVVTAALLVFTGAAVIALS